MPITKAQRKAGVKSTRNGVVTRMAGQPKDNSDGPSRGSNPQVNAINEARYKNIQQGKDAYSGEAAAKGQIGDTLMNTVSPNPDMNTPINTGQPSPSTIQVGSPSLSLPTPPEVKEMDIASKYKTGFANAQAQGLQAPETSAGGSSVVSNAMAQFPEQGDTSMVDAYIAEDKGVQAIKEKYAEYFDPENQRASLMDTYNKLYKKSGLDDLDEEIIDAQTIIEGTEDDIRNEIEMAGGFGTDSQVQAMALSRNKVLLKNYNNLVALRESKANNLNTMMSFAEKDRAYADSQIDRMFQFDIQMQNYRDNFIQNTRDQYNKYTPQQLQAMLSGNPRQLAFAESIMGLGQGGLAKLASYVAPLSEMDKLDLEGKRLYNQKLRSELGGGGNSAPKVTSVNGVDSIWDGTKFIPAPTSGGGAGGGLSLAQAKGNIDLIDNLTNDKYLSKAVGANELGRISIANLFTGGKDDFVAGIEQLRSQLTLDSLINAKARGATFGALSEGELKTLQASASKLGTWAVEKNGKVVGYQANQEDFKKELDKIRNFAKLDYIIKGGNPADVGVEIMANGVPAVKNSDGTYTELQ